MHVTDSTTDQLELDFGSEQPTLPDLERAALAARIAARAFAKKPDDDLWCDSEAPTGVEVERPVFPGPPRSPSV